MKIVPTPYLGQSVVKNEWIDANGHMNVGHYLSAFDDGSCAMFDELGLGWDYTEEGKGTIFIMSSSLDYLQELLEGDELKISTWLITFDKRRVHIFQELFHAEKGFLAARAEFMFAHVCLKTRKASDMPEDALQRLSEIESEHKLHLNSKFIGREISLKWKPRHA